MSSILQRLRTFRAGFVDRIACLPVEAIWPSAGMGLNTATVRAAIQKAQALRDEFNATDLRNVRYGLQRVFLSFLEDC